MLAGKMRTGGRIIWKNWGKGGIAKGEVRGAEVRKNMEGKVREEEV